VAITRGSALIAEADIVNLTGRQDLARLETGAEFDRAALLITATDWVYDRLVALGIDPSLLSNQTSYERAVARYFIFLLAEGGYLSGEDPAVLEERAEKAFDEVRPTLSSGDEGINTAGAVPAIGNFDADAVYGPSDRSSTTPLYWDDFPQTR
jgi:hypothetical protein